MTQLGHHNFQYIFKTLEFKLFDNNKYNIIQIISRIYTNNAQV